MRKRINLIDKNFAGRDTENMPGVDFAWHTENELVSDHVFITDYCLNYVDKIRCPSIKKVAWLIEPRAILPQVYDYIFANYKKFDYVLSFDSEICKLPNGHFMPFGTFWADKKNNAQKTKTVSMIASNKGWTTGHALRQQIVNQIKNIDYYGGCINKPIDTKNLGLDDYMFSVAVENSIQDSYFTEKILDCFATKTVPIYWGTRKITNFFNSKGIIMFSSLQELEQILPTLSADLYASMHDAIEENFNAINEYNIPELQLQKHFNFLLK